MAVEQKKVAKAKLADLLGKEDKSNADFFRGEPERRKFHTEHRAPRDWLKRIATTDGGYRPLSGDAKRDFQLNQLALEFIANGMNKTKAISAVFGIPLNKAKSPTYMKLFESAWFKQKIHLMALGVDGKLKEEVPDEYLLIKLMRIIESVILDFAGDDGRYLTVDELRRLPREMQAMLENFEMVNTTRQVALRDQFGQIVKQDNGEPYTVEQRDQVVRFKLIDKLKAMELFAKLMKWISNNTEVNVNLFNPTLLVEANERIKRLRRDDMKQLLKELPQIDAVMEYDDSPEYAGEVLDVLLGKYTLRQIEAHTGICKRSLSYFRQRGFGNYPRQLAMEILAGIKKLGK